MFLVIEKRIMKEGSSIVKHSMTVVEMKELLTRALAGRLGTCKDNQPYVIPITFVYDAGKIYFHSAPQGKKIENMKANPRVCFQVDEYCLVPSSIPCEFTMHYRSVLVFGKVCFLTSHKEKLRALRSIVDKYDAAHSAKPIDEAMVDRLEVGEVTIEKMTGKKNE